MIAVFATTVASLSSWYGRFAGSALNSLSSGGRIVVGHNRALSAMTRALYIYDCGKGRG